MTMLTPSLRFALLLRRWSQRAGQGSCRFRPRLEGLEDRLTPATFNVTTTADLVAPGDGKLSLREAIGLANATDEADRIVLPAGVYAIQRPGALEDDNATGDFDITRPLTIKGPQTGTAVIDAAGLDRVFHAHPLADTVAFTRLTIQGGSSTKEGGGIFVNDVELSVALTLRSCVVRANMASVGGGISAGAGQTTLIRCRVTNNGADASGGGIFFPGRLTDSAAALTITDSVVA